MRQVNERGWKGLLTQLYTVSFAEKNLIIACEFMCSFMQIGDIKFGVLKGTDKFGNKYYEDLDLPYGQHRWVEFADIHNPDPVLITPDWHGWMHHVFDETPDEMRLVDGTAADGSLVDGQFDIERVDSDAVFTTHLGLARDKTGDLPHHNLSQYRARGYGVGSLLTEPNDPEPYYIQPGHILYKGEEGESDGRFDKLKGWQEWSPDAENEKK